MRNIFVLKIKFIHKIHFYKHFIAAKLGAFGKFLARILRLFLGATTLSISTFSIMTFSITTLSITTFRITTLNIMTFSIVVNKM